MVLCGGALPAIGEGVQAGGGDGVWRGFGWVSNFLKVGRSVVMVVRSGVMMVLGSGDRVLGNVGEMGDGGSGVERFELAENDQKRS